MKIPAVINGSTLRALRLSTGATQSELAKHLGYYTRGEPNRSVICRMENGDQVINIRIQMLIRLFFENKETSDAKR